MKAGRGGAARRGEPAALKGTPAALRGTPVSLRGTPVSPGTAAGIMFRYEPEGGAEPEGRCGEGEAEGQLARFAEVRRAAEAELLALEAQVERESPEQAKIFAAHRAILNDPALYEEVEVRVRADRWTGNWAVYRVFERYIALLREAPDALIRERAADFADVRKRLLRIWHGRAEASLSNLGSPVIVAARELLPSDTAALDRANTLALLTETGGAFSHAAIIARGCGIPAAAGIPRLMDYAETGAAAAVDGGTGEVVIRPDAALLARFARAREEAGREEAADAAFLPQAARTADGVRIAIGLNIASADEAELAGERYTDMAGLFRTEFLFLGKAALPSEDEQAAVYAAVLRRYAPRPVMLRTLDAGGDKALAALALPPEDNPFLGNRALRLCFARPELFKTQLRAALRASVCGNLRLLLPMVGSLDDLRRAKAFIAEAASELDAEGVPYRADFKTGIMMEVPSIAMLADAAAREADFASLGTNDLCQYLTAVDRMNPAVAPYYQTYHPGLFRIIEQAARAFAAAGKPVCVCGEMGGDRYAAPALVGMGIRQLSMGFASLGRIKRTLASLSIAQMEALAARVVALPTAGDAEAFLKANIPA